MLIVRYADDVVLGFQHRSDAERPQRDLAQRLATFRLGLNAEKTRLIRCGRFAAQQCKERGLGRPETFQFLGFTHYCTTTKDGRFLLLRKTISNRMAAKLREVRTLLMRRRHWPLEAQGRWLASVVRGHLAYYAVPGNIHQVVAFRDQLVRLWYGALRRRGQRHRLNWQKMRRDAERLLPPARITHPWPDQRFDARTQVRSPVRTRAQYARGREGFRSPRRRARQSASRTDRSVGRRCKYRLARRRVGTLRTKGSRADLALDHHRRHCCGSGPRLRSSAAFWIAARTSRDVAYVVSDVSVLCPRAVVHQGNGAKGRAHAGNEGSPSSSAPGSPASPSRAYAATIGEVEEVKREKDTFFQRLLGNTERQAAAAGVELDVELRPGHAAELIIRVATEKQADLIVLGHKGHFLRDHLLGSTADRVAEHADCPVMIVK